MTTSAKHSTNIPFNRASFGARERQYLEASLSSGKVAGDGPFTRRCQTLLEHELGCPRVLLTSSCTHALEMAALLLDLAPGDEVIMPSFAFVSCGNAVALRGARPVFVDVRPDTLNLDERRLKQAITPRTRAVLVIHYAGVSCEMDVICSIARSHGLTIIEDNAHGLFGAYQGQLLGTFGDLATLSFHETKNFSCGEGGALVINDSSYIERAEILREKGTNRSRFFRGEVDKYTWVDIGSSYLMSDLAAAILLAQLDEREQILRRRAALVQAYQVHLAEWATANQVQLLHAPADCEPAYHLFFLLMPSPATRQALIAHLRSRGIVAVFHYVPLHLSEMGRTLGYAPHDLPVTEASSERLVRLPMFNDMRDVELATIIAAIRQFRT